MLLLTMNPRVSAWVSQAYTWHFGHFYLSALEQFLKLTLYVEFLDKICSPSRPKRAGWAGLRGEHYRILSEEKLIKHFISPLRPH